MDEDHAGHRLFFLCTECAFSYFDVLPEEPIGQSAVVVMLLRHVDHIGVVACDCGMVLVSKELLPLSMPAAGTATAAHVN